MDWFKLTAGHSRRGCFGEVQQEVTFLVVAVWFVHGLVAVLGIGGLPVLNMLRAVQLGSRPNKTRRREWLQVVAISTAARSIRLELELLVGPIDSSSAPIVFRKGF